MVDTGEESDPYLLHPYTQGIVLLKNTGILPFKENDSLRLEGPNMWDSIMPLGNYNGTPLHTVTIGEGLTKMANPTSRIIVYAGGLSPQLEGEELPIEKEGFYKGDRTRIELPQEQVEEIKAFKAQGYSIVLVLCTGSAIALENVIDDCDAVLVGWYGGQLMGTAMRFLLYGHCDDFGRLPVTFYRSTDQLPPFDDYNMTGRTYRYPASEPLFPFGFGYSYSFFSIKNPSVDEANFTVSGTASLCNTDAHQAPSHRTIIQVYLKNNNDYEAPHKQLIGTASLSLTEENHLVPFTIQLDPFWFRQYNPATGLMEEPKDGTPFTIQVGFSSDDRDLQDFPFIYHNRK